jgi:hypothetical protein
MAGNICGVIDAITNFQLRAMELLNGRFQSLRRLSALLEKAGDLTGFIPDISKLIPLAQIDTTLYEQLRVECPYLNLPPASASAEQFLGQLRAQVNAAYGSILSQLNTHPFNVMGMLQEKLNEYQNKMNFSVLQGQDFLQCLQAVCEAAASVGNTVQNAGRSASQVITTSTTYYRDFVEGGGQVLSGTAKEKYDDLVEVKDGVGDLLNVNVSGFQNIETNPTQTRTNTDVFSNIIS